MIMIKKTLIFSFLMWCIRGCRLAYDCVSVAATRVSLGATKISLDLGLVLPFQKLVKDSAIIT